MDKWTELRTALQVAKLGTVSAAAQVLGLHRATVNRHIDLLEGELGARIFIRHARGYTLTELGEEVLRVARKADELIEDLAGHVRGQKNALDGEIKITVLPRFLKVLIDPIAQFRHENPNCRVLVIASAELEKLEFGDAHLALRVGRKPDNPDYVVTPFRKLSINLYAHENYIKRKGLPVSAADFEGHEFAMPAELNIRFPFSDWIVRNVKDSQVAFKTADQTAVWEAITAGIGLGFLTDLDVQDRSDLHPILPRDDAWTVPIWLVTHRDLHRTEKVQAMLRLLRADNAAKPT